MIISFLVAIGAWLTEKLLDPLFRIFKPKTPIEKVVEKETKIATDAANAPSDFKIEKDLKDGDF